MLIDEIKLKTKVELQNVSFLLSYDYSTESGSSIRCSEDINEGNWYSARKPYSVNDKRSCILFRLPRGFCVLTYFVNYWRFAMTTKLGRCLCFRIWKLAGHIKNGTTLISLLKNMKNKFPQHVSNVHLVWLKVWIKKEIIWTLK